MDLILKVVAVICIVALVVIWSLFLHDRKRE
jgi:hypothetical protein